jgi:hypothetical protein
LLPPITPADTKPRTPIDPDPAPYLPFRDQPRPEFDFPQRPEAPCDRVYNHRNCCDDERKCELARQYVRNDKISNIQLDITPAFTNTELDLSTEIAMRRQLANAPARIWRDRAGRQLAEGRFVDYQFGRVHVATSDGQTVKLPFRDLSDDDLCFVTAWWSLPTECALGDESFTPRNWLASSLSWKASALCHKPLYFEQVALERYGHTTGSITEPFVTTAHFFASGITLPYQLGMHPPHECMYPLGYYRPGSCAPWLLPAIPLSVRGGLAQAGVILGGIYIVP